MKSEEISEENVDYKTTNWEEYRTKIEQQLTY